jgi:hypothetical protein
MQILKPAPLNSHNSFSLVFPNQRNQKRVIEAESEKKERYFESARERERR